MVQETVAQLGELKRFASELLDARDWNAVREGVEAKRYQGPDGNGTFVLVRSAERQRRAAMRAWTPPVKLNRLGAIVCRERLGGLLRFHDRNAA